MGCFESKSDQPAQPATVRGHTDIFWLILYVVFWIALIVIAIFSFIYGNPLRIINGYDSFGNTCGVHSNDKYSNIPLSGMNTADKPYLFFLDVKELRHTLTICVKECPKRELTNAAELYRYNQETFTKLCRYDFNMSFLLTPEASGPKYFDYTGPCPPLPVYQSAPVLHRCIPTGANAPLQQVKKMYALINSWEATQQVFSDLYKAWPTIVLVCALSLVFSIIIIAMLHWLATIVSWIICIFVVVASVGITAVLWWSYYRTKHTLDTDMQLSYLEELVRNETTIYVVAIAATCIMIILLVLVYYLREKLTGLAALFEEAGKCMLQLPGLAGPPLLAFLALVVFLAFWVSVVICLATANYPGLKPLLSPITQLEENSSLTNDTKLKPELLVEYHEANVLRHMLWIYIIGLIWTSEFIFACQQLAIAGAVAFWYFRKPTDTPVLHAIAKLVKYHLGSVAKGSLIITIFKIPRLILTYLYAKLKRHQQDGSECASCCLRCCICSFWLLEKFIRYLNHNAYTVIAIEGVNFCPAAKIAWNALVTNALQVATINGIGDLVLFLGKLAVAALCGLISILLLRDNADLHFYMAPVIIITVFAFFVAHIILSLYEMVVDTLFLCVCEDRTINGNSGRWKESNLARLLGETPEMDAVEAPMQEVALTPITKQPFSAAQFLQAEMDNSKA
ncbi:choline transporter-like 1 isoform X2 [Anopheles bellator]|uniref:choline transporter-like 1 isoform X2 n=1 Tax=Anopheles bellator TaxID=139047 RepID=UPI0026470D3C|nr:choline transporter-like 1 isoform X2 [Anopheles bellator]